jgi:hypothetical protein
MKPIVFVAITGIAVAAGLTSSPAEAQTRGSSSFSLTYRGFNYVSYYNGAYENADSLPALVGTGATSAALTLEYGIDVQTSAVYADATYTDSLTALAATITEANSRGLSVMVRPLIDFLDPAKIGSYNVGDWRSLYNPADAAAFFASYKTMIVAVAQVAQANGAAILCIGAELDQLTGPDYLSSWTDIIAAVRAVFSGKLTYSADWDDNISPWQGQHGLTAGTGKLTSQVSFWSQLDYLGIDCYAPISDAANPVLADLVAGWTLVPSDPTSLAVTGDQSLISYFASVATQTGKPLLFTEFGYESASDAAQQPSGSSTNIYDPALQANLYAAFFDAWQQSGSDSLIGVYFWNWDPNAAEVGPGNGPNFSPQALSAQLVVTAAFGMRPVNGTLTGTHDFNGDGMSDIAWRDIGGDAAIWLMNGTQIWNANAAGIGTVSTAWTIVGTGDFNGDRRSDILWRDTSGNVAIWLMNGTQVLNPNAAGVGNVPTTWSIVGTGDFNGDGMSDILWRDTSGNVAIWLMNGTQVLNPDTAGVGNVAATWSIVGTGDFNGDGKWDILWRNTSGNVAIWLMNGTSVLNPNTSGIGNVPTAWSVVGTGDFNGDGYSDVLWHDTGGNVAAWLMNGTQVLNPNTAGVGNVPTIWTLAGSGDFNGDGMSDVLWHDTSGNVAVWEMSGTRILNPNMAGVGNVPTVWAIQDPLGP